MIHVLAGDIGGTKTLLQLAEFSPGALRPARVLKEQRFDSDSHDDLAPIARRFLNGIDPATVHGACFGVAGPVSGDAARQQAQLTNLPWQLDSQRLATDLGLRAVRLINDFQAVGHGIETLEAEDLATLHPAPVRPNAPRVVLGAGTGLGVALLLPCNGRYEVFPTEGGHADLAPADATQDGLLTALRAQFGHVSWERVLSGPGLVNIYRYLLLRDGADAASDPLLSAVDPAAAIAGAHDNARAAEAVMQFTALYGACAGNLALTCLAHGGVYLAGGIAPKLLHELRHGPFLPAYLGKGRMRPLVAAMPIQVVTNPEVGLLGALLLASRL